MADSQSPSVSNCRSGTGSDSANGAGVLADDRSGAKCVIICSTRRSTSPKWSRAVWGGLALPTALTAWAVGHFKRLTRRDHHCPSPQVLDLVMPLALAYRHCFTLASRRLGIEYEHGAIEVDRPGSRRRNRTAAPRRDREGHLRSIGVDRTHLSGVSAGSEIDRGPTDRADRRPRELETLAQHGAAHPAGLRSTPERTERRLMPVRQHWSADCGVSLAWESTGLDRSRQREVR
jgi:hypothetical protein